jgi:hypothetical protein
MGTVRAPEPFHPLARKNRHFFLKKQLLDAEIPNDTPHDSNVLPAVGVLFERRTFIPQPQKKGVTRCE